MANLAPQHDLHAVPLRGRLGGLRAPPPVLSSAARAMSSTQSLL